MTTRDSSLIVLAALVVVLSGCAQKQTAKEEPASPTAAAPAPPAEPRGVQQQPAESAASPAPRPAGAPSPTAGTLSSGTPPSVDEFTDEPALNDVFFDPGRADVGPKGAAVMKANARWIVENPGYLVLIEGHTDYKGNREANLAMGERRAKAAVSVLLKAGVADVRLWTVSHGSDHPVCAEKTDACAAKNRRVHFRVKKP
jgi:peptidoglycan-associated lipoprotein